jgi:hypothetical protein
MTTFPGVDMIVDVARAANPQKRDMAMQRLSQMAAENATAREAFAGALAGAAKARPTQSNGPNALAPVASAAFRASAPAPGPASKAAEKFEALILQTFVEEILPRAEHGFYGDAASAGVWRSMSAEHISASIATAGGLGLRKVLESHFAKLGAASAAASSAAG